MRNDLNSTTTVMANRSGKCLVGCLVGGGIFLALVVAFFAFGFYLISAETKDAKLVVTPFIQAVESGDYETARGMLSGTNFADGAALADFFKSKGLESWSGWDLKREQDDGDATVFKLVFQTAANATTPVYLWMVPDGDSTKILTLKAAPPEKPETGSFEFVTKTSTTAQIILPPVRRIVLTDNLDDLAEDRTEFKLGPRTIYAMFVHRGAKPGSTVFVKWLADEEGEMKEVAEASLELEKPDHYVVGHINMELPIPANNYKVELYIDGKRRAMKTFSIVIE